MLVKFSLGSRNICVVPDVEVNDLCWKNIVAGNRVQLVEKAINGELEELEEPGLRLLHLRCVLDVLPAHNSSLSISKGVSESCLRLLNLGSVDQVSHCGVKCPKKLVFSCSHLRSVAHEPGLNHPAERRLKDPKELLLRRCHLSGVLNRTRGKFAKKSICSRPESLHELLLGTGNLLCVINVVSTATGGVADWGGLKGESSIRF